MSELSVRNCYWKLRDEGEGVGPLDMDGYFIFPLELLDDPRALENAIHDAKEWNKVRGAGDNALAKRREYEVEIPDEDLRSCWRGIRAMRRPWRRARWAMKWLPRKVWIAAWTPTWHEGRGPYLSIGMYFIAVYRGY